ncbi:Putative type I restriction enzyme [Acidipropionibacterium acidipropionici ATCC 4875]|uniref:Type I restriction enzyme n=1 Tax=Acidipropionibacterium acidipropionici (strain ATCC 4875 / DSM 20272 / JCM 6432 / NBRC 12425 / NCIMB 8070 / 4) TaxID=1171373 RepID=K7RT04_ACIA4|nr:Putative type I restriction enzyme [Acidipropionibacterium acidipropionici ATCC 4875]
MVGSLAATIAKKRAIKQGMMQELLTGRTRLSGYTGLWRRVLFSDIVTPVSERVDPGRAIGRVVELEHLSQSTGELVGYSDVRSTESLKTSFHSGDVLGKLRAYLRKFWLADFDGFCSTEIWALRPIPKVSDGAFIRYVVEEDAFIEAASTSYGTHMPRSDWRVVWLFPDEGVAHVARRAGASVAG